LLTDCYIVEKKVYIKIENLAATPTVEILGRLQWDGVVLFFFEVKAVAVKEGLNSARSTEEAKVPLWKAPFYRPQSDSPTFINTVAGALDALID
jgi:hypothetical protein